VFGGEVADGATDGIGIHFPGFVVLGDGEGLREKRRRLELAIGLNAAHFVLGAFDVLGGGFAFEVPAGVDDWDRLFGDVGGLFWTEREVYLLVKHEF
jgi:hypothetical protein